VRIEPRFLQDLELAAVERQLLREGRRRGLEDLELGQALDHALRAHSRSYRMHDGLGTQVIQGTLVPPMS
jgi:hypothetical protein